MIETEPIDPLDPFAVHFHRETMEGEGVALILLADSVGGLGESTLTPCADWLKNQKRVTETRVIAIDPAAPRLGDRIGKALALVDQPIVAIFSTTEPPTPEHLQPLLKAINQADHVVGRRSAGPLAAVGRWLARIPRRLVFGVPVLDVHSPCRMHRLEKLRTIPLQSGSSFLDTEILAKATFLGHLLDEVAIPPLPGRVWRRGWFRDLRLVFKRPTFRPPSGVEIKGSSGPLEQPERQPESSDGPRGEDPQGHENLNLSNPSALQNDHPQGVDKLG